MTGESQKRGVQFLLMEVFVSLKRGADSDEVRGVSDH